MLKNKGALPIIFLILQFLICLMNLILQSKILKSVIFL